MESVGRVRRGQVYLVSLDPTRGSEMRKTRPCLIVSPDEINDHLRTTVVAPLTTGGKSYPTRVPCTFEGVRGHLALDQIRTVDRERLLQCVGVIAPDVLTRTLTVLRELFEE